MQTTVTPARQLLAILNSAAAKADKAQAKKELRAAYPLMYQTWTSNNR